MVVLQAKIGEQQKDNTFAVKKGFERSDNTNQYIRYLKK